MNTILLQPTDVLFFRDGRPMEDSLAGHGAAWPLPNVIDAAFHAALHRSGLSGHYHDHRRGAVRSGKDNRRFGSLVTAGPFPVCVESNGRPLEKPVWFFPRPLDLRDTTLRPALFPANQMDRTLSSLPEPLEYPIANSQPPSKETPATAWLSAAAYQAYLNPSDPPDLPDWSKPSALPPFLSDSDFFDAEATIGIAIDPATGTTGRGEAAGRIYSAYYLRLREGWRIGVFAKMEEKQDGDSRRIDLIRDLLNQPCHILVGGQQRLCTATRIKVDTLPLPRGMTSHFNKHERKWLVKWILLSPAIWPEIQANEQKGVPYHPGGGLPNWVRASDGRVMLRAGQRQPRYYEGKHTRGYAEDAKEIAAKLVAAIVPKPIVVTGWALPNDTVRPEGGAKSTHLAVPAGAVYYFEADSETDAQNLAAALNWHGPVRDRSDRSDPSDPSNFTTIRNRRSTLLGEKGFGLGVCGTWEFYRSDRSDPSDSTQQNKETAP